MSGGFTKNQVKWFRRVYGGQCHFPIYSEEQGFHYCLSSNEIQVHHIEPQRYSRDILCSNPNRMYNGIALCSRHHVGKGYNGSLHLDDIVDIIHPDITWALRNYRRTEKKSFDMVFGRRNELLSDSGIYWLDDYDNFLRETAEYKISEYLLKQPKDKFPLKRRKHT